MGRSPESKRGIEDQAPLFSSLPISRRPPSVDPATGGAPPVWSVTKARLISEYVQNFQYVTRGGLYIDGFAAPQKRESKEVWTAKRVLEVEPKRIRRVWLCDIDPKGVQQLRSLKNTHQTEGRHVNVLQGDFNIEIERILRTGRLRPKTPVLVFLDQRTAECHWSTVRRLAFHHRRRKIELIYFFGTGWIHRALSSAKTAERRAELDRWWGRPTWRNDLLSIPQVQQAEVVRDRFLKELEYPYVRTFPVFENDASTRVLYHLVHASSHPKANNLMIRAYRKICGGRAGSPADDQVELFG